MWDQLMEAFKANRPAYADALQENIGKGTSNHSQAGMSYAEAPDMSQFAQQPVLQSLLQPHAQRPQPEMRKPLMGYQNPYLMGLLGGSHGAT